MVDVVYTIAEHDGGWAYKFGDVFSETFPDRATAEAVARQVASEQRVPGETESISWEDESGRWHDEIASGSDRPNAIVRTGLAESVDRADPDRRGRLPAPSWPSRLAEDPMAALVLAGIVGVLLATFLRRSRRNVRA